jgi:hypothetical protein
MSVTVASCALRVGSLLLPVAQSLVVAIASNQSLCRIYVDLYECYQARFCFNPTCVGLGRFGKLLVLLAGPPMRLGNLDLQITFYQPWHRMWPV